MSKKDKVIQILHDSFYDNGSIEFVVGSRAGKSKRLRALLDYSWNIGVAFGKVYLSEDAKACAIVLDSQKKKTTLKSIVWDIQLLFRCIGLVNVPKVLKRESHLKHHHPKGNFIHLWYIGVTPEHQGSGVGSRLLTQILTEFEDVPIYLETSNPRNFPLYERHGFKRVADLDDLGYALKVYLKS